MKVAFFYSLFLTLSMFLAHAQATYVPIFGKLTQEDLAVTSYPLDPEAPAVVLYNRGKYTIDVINNSIWHIKEVHCKIKVFDAKKFEHNTVEIPYYRSNQDNVTNIKAITHNENTESQVSEQSIFDADVGSNRSVKKFVFPDVKDGSILEYTYRIETPSIFFISTWTFMHDLPTIYSELHTEIPANYHYNRSLRGEQQLDVNQAEVRESCFIIPGFKVIGDCEVATYAMRDVPAFKEERYMLSPMNYIPSLKFELSEYIRLNNTREVTSKSWENIDNNFEANSNVGGQLQFSSYFRRKIPKTILSISDDLERAKAVYYFIQSEIKWNNRIDFVYRTDVKNALKKGVGSSSEINLALVNALEAAGLNAKVIFIATRDRALPTKEHPVFSDFNYALVFLKIGNQKFFLDASEKKSEFGVLPFRTLNIRGRVMDFQRGSYWEPIVSFKRNMHYVTLQLELDLQGGFSGKVKEMSTGQIALSKRQEISLLSDQEIEKRKQSAIENVDISEYRIENKTELDQAYTETYTITLPEYNLQDQVFLYPFLIQNYFSENPFSAETRQYPIDIGFPVINNYLISIDVKDQYEIIKVPKNRVLKLPLNDGEVSVIYDRNDSKINIRLNVKLNTTSYSTEAYQSLSEFFDVLMKIQYQEPIELKRI